MATRPIPRGPLLVDTGVITQRAQFAVQILAGLFANTVEFQDYDDEHLCAYAVEMADKLIHTLSKET